MSCATSPEPSSSSSTPRGVRRLRAEAGPEESGSIFQQRPSCSVSPAAAANLAAASSRTPRSEESDVRVAARAVPSLRSHILRAPSRVRRSSRAPRHLVSGPRCRGRPVPRVQIHLRHPPRKLRRAQCVPAGVERNLRVDIAPTASGVSERHSISESVEQACSLAVSKSCALSPSARAARRTTQLRRCCRQRATGVTVEPKPVEAQRERRRLAQAGRQRQRVRELLAAGLEVVERQGYFQEHEGIALGGGDDPLQYLWRQRTGGLVRVMAAEASGSGLEPQLGELRRNSFGIVLVLRKAKSMAMRSACRRRAAKVIATRLAASSH